jgi:hypothetical protein
MVNQAMKKEFGTKFLMRGLWADFLCVASGLMSVWMEACGISETLFVILFTNTSRKKKLGALLAAAGLALYLRVGAADASYWGEVRPPTLVSALGSASHHSQPR